MKTHHARHPLYLRPVCKPVVKSRPLLTDDPAQVTCAHCLRALRQGVLYHDPKTSGTVLWAPFAEAK